VREGALVYQRDQGATVAEASGRRRWRKAPWGFPVPGRGGVEQRHDAARMAARRDRDQRLLAAIADRRRDRQRRASAEGTRR